jgi:hypothetical protein
MGPELFFFLMVATAAVIIVWSLMLRYKRQELRHRERMAALEKGAPIPEEPPERPPVPWSPRVYLLRGLIWLFTGLGLSIFLLGLSFTISNRPQTYEDRLWRANQFRREGVPEDQVKDFLSRNEPVRREFPEGVALIGLIPIGVGLAYLIYYRGESKKAEVVS